MRAYLAAAALLATGGVQAAHAGTPQWGLTATPASAMVLGIPLNQKANLRIRTNLVPGSTGLDRALVRRQSSSMVDFLPGLGGFRLSAGLRFEKRAKGSLARLANGAGAGLDIGEGGSSRKSVGSGGTRPALTMGYGLATAHGMMLGIEAGAILDKDRNPLKLDPTDMMGAARTARHQLTGHGDLDIGEVVRLSLVQRF